MIRTLIVDDEQPARERLQQMLSSMEGIEVIGDAEDGEQAGWRYEDGGDGRHHAVP